MSSLQQHLTNRKRTVADKSVITFRPQRDVARMLEAALRDHSNLSAVVNAGLRHSLTLSGYAEKVNTADRQRKKAA
jgi:hypothetical protein